MFNQLLPQYLNSESKALHHCWGHTEDVHLNIETEKNIFDKFTAFSNLENSQAKANIEFS